MRPPPNGNVQGADAAVPACTYLGVPYAAPPVGESSVAAAAARAPWAPGTLNATATPPICAQGANAAAAMAVRTA